MIAKDLGLMLQVSIHLDAEHEDVTYKNYDTIKGVVDMNVFQQVSLRHLKVKLVTRTTIAFVCQHDNIMEKHESVEEKLIIAAHLLPNTSSKSGEYLNQEIEFKKGRHYYPFEFRIPMKKRCKHCNAENELIPLFELPEVTSVNYFVRVSMDGLNINSIRAYKHIRFMPLDKGFNSPTELSAQIIKRQTFCSYADTINSDESVLRLLEDSDSLITPSADPSQILASLLESTVDLAPDESFSDFFADINPHFDVLTYVKAALNDGRLVPSKKLPLELFLGSSEDPITPECKVYLQSVFIELMADTKVLITNNNKVSSWSTVSHSIPLYYLPPQNIEFSMTREDATEAFLVDGELIVPPYGCMVPSQIHDNAILPSDIIPTFHSCKLQRSYSLNVTTGFSGDPIDTYCNNGQVDSKVQNIQFTFKDVQVLSGLVV